MGLALTFLGIALALLPLGFTAVGYELSSKQGYNILVLAALFVVGAVVVFFWPWIKEAWSWIRRDAELQRVNTELQRAEEALKNWRERFEEKQSEAQTLDTVREQQLRKIREAEQERDELRTENEELIAKASVVSAWDDPEFKFTTVNKKTFRNETVPLDGFLYTNCSFENVTFVYKGEQPYGLVAFKIIGEDTVLKAESAPLWAYSRLLNILGYIEQEVEKGDALRPDAKVARIEDGQVEIFESKDEENERVRREREKLEAERDTLREESELRRTERDAEARALSFHVSEWLAKFLEDCKQENLQNQEVMARYNQELSGKAVGTINDLKKFGLWKPKEQDRERFEHPENQQDIEGLSSYLRWVGLNL